MSKLFFKGRIDAREKYQNFGYNTNRQVKLGSVNSPLTLVVNSIQRKEEIEQILLDNSLVANIEINSDGPENLIPLETLLSKPKPQTFAKTLNRNDPCSCNSGKKFKKCCGA
jgi:SWIM/SEC-C metal-binding protein